MTQAKWNLCRWSNITHSSHYLSPVAIILTALSSSPVFLTLLCSIFLYNRKIDIICNSSLLSNLQWLPNDYRNKIKCLKPSCFHNLVLSCISHFLILTSLIFISSHALYSSRLLWLERQSPLSTSPTLSLEPTSVWTLSHCDSSKFHLLPFLHSLNYIINTNLLTAQHNLIKCCENQLITPCDCCMYTWLILSWKQGEWFSFHKAWSVCKSAASAVPGNMWELQNLKPHPRPTGQNLHFNMAPRWLMCTLTFEKCWLILLLCTWNPEQGCIHAVGVQHIIV